MMTDEDKLFRAIADVLIDYMYNATENIVELADNDEKLAEQTMQSIVDHLYAGIDT